MDNRKKKLLQAHQKDIVLDLDPIFILDELYSKEAINRDQLEHLYNITDRVDRTRFLLSLIQNGTNRAFEVFVDSLAKDYRWLYEKFDTANMNDSILSESYEDSLSRGDVPRVPQYYVQRAELEREVANNLMTLSRHHVMVLHGMSGCGKSSLVIGTLRHHSNLIIDNFGGVVFWLNMGNIKTEDDILAQQIKLYRKTSQYRPNETNFMNSSISMSSIGSNSDSQSLLLTDWSSIDLRDKLKAIFLRANLKDALLILDEVNEKKIVEAFDIGCKILITTRDTDVVADLRPRIIKINNSFEESESLQLFATCLDITVTQLPRQAKRLHTICKGSPFHIALIGAQLAEDKERVLNDNSRWDYYINKLKKTDIMSFIRRSPDQCDPMKPIEICINSLEPHIRQLFNMLAVLPDNIKLSAKVISTLWGKQLNEVESIMKKLRSKSLINQLYVHEQKNYIYEVHDLIINYLRSLYSQEQINQLHVGLLKNYGYDNLDDLPEQLVDDGYIAFYIGYHIDHAKKSNKNLYFNKLYLNLKFLGNKVRLTGPADVIMDFQKYENSICHNRGDQELFFDIKDYLGTHGIDLYRYPSTDIVQNILQHVSKGFLYQKAYQVAQEQSSINELYFDFLHEQDVDDAEKIKHSTIDVKQTITCVSFLSNYVLVGTESGLIKIFYFYTNKLKKELQNSDHCIKYVAACPMNICRIAAIDTNGKLHMWYIDDLDPEISDTTIVEECDTQSDVDVLDYETASNFTDSHIVVPPTMGAYLTFSWANNDETLITHTKDMIMIFSPSGKAIKLLDTFEKDIQISCSLYSNDDSKVIMSYFLKNAYHIDIIHLTTNETLKTFTESSPILKVLCVPGAPDKILVLNETEVNEYSWKSSLSYPRNNNVYNREKIISNKEVKDNIKFISAVVNKSGSLLFVSTDDSRIICIDLKTNSYAFDLDNRRGNVVSMDVSEVQTDEFVPGSDVLLSGTGTVENSVKVWTFDAAYISQATHKNRKVRLTARFDVSFSNVMSPKAPESAQSDNHPNINVTPKRHKSFVNVTEVEKKIAKKTLSLDRHTLKPLQLKGISNGNDDIGFQPLLAVVDDRNNIQIMRGRKVLSNITVRVDDEITTIKISPCNQYIVYGLQSGTVQQYTLRTKETKVIMDIYSQIEYLNFVNPKLLIVSGKSRCMMAYRLIYEGEWKLQMMQKGKSCLGSQEILNGNRKKNGPPGALSSSGSEASISSKERLFRGNEGKTRLNRLSSLVKCFWVEGIGLLTVESNGTIKLWDQDLKLITVLSGRQTDVYIKCAAFQRNIIAICDDYGKFQTFELIESSSMIQLHTIQDYKLNNKIVSCDLTKDGNILAMGLDSGCVVIWNVPTKRQLTFLKHHKTQVQACMFSPVPNKLYRSSTHSPTVNHSFQYTNTNNHDDEQTPLVLVTMASEIVWWNISYLMKMPANKRLLRPGGRNVMTPVTSPVESRTELTAALDNLRLSPSNQYFFSNGFRNICDSWEGLWRHKRCKGGCKKKEILACVKLSGMTAKKLCVDENFSSFVTVDNPGHIHIMNVMRNSSVT